jgi:hypothetical protein
MPLAAVLNAINLVGSGLPAFKALFETVLESFNEDDQTTLKTAYAEMQAKSDAAHAAAQKL